MKIVPDVSSNLDATNVDLVSEVTCEANGDGAGEDAIGVYVVTRRRDGAQRIALSSDDAAVSPGRVRYLTREGALQMAAALQTAAAKLED